MTDEPARTPGEGPMDRFWEDDADWVLLRTFHTVSTVKLVVGEGGLSVADLVAVRRQFNEYCDVAPSAVRRRFGAPGKHVIFESHVSGSCPDLDAERTAAHAVASGLNVTFEYETKVSYLPMTRGQDRHAMLIESDEEAARTAKEMIEAGCPVIDDPMGGAEP